MQRSLRLPGWLQTRAVGLLLTTAGLGLMTALLVPLGTGHILNIALLYLLATLLVAAAGGHVVGLYGAVLADLLVNFFFVAPVHTFTVHEPANALALVLFLAVAAVGSSMLALLRRQAALALSREAETSILLELNHVVGQARTADRALAGICDMMRDTLQARACCILHERPDGWHVNAATPGGAAPPTRDETSMVTLAIETQRVVGRGGPPRGRLRFHRRSGPVERATYVPFPATAPERGALRILGAIDPPAVVDTDRLLLAFAEEASVALHRVRLAAEAQRAEALERADEFKTVLLSTVSHDLRSPLTAIKAAVGNLRAGDVQWSEDDVARFLETIESQTDRLTAIVSDLLQMSRLEGGATTVSIEPVEVAPLLAEVVQAAQPATAGRRVTVESPDDLWIAADYALLVEALANLIENAGRYSTPGGGVRVAAARTGDRATITIADEGPGIPLEDVPRVFDKFYRGVQAKKSAGTGLGLSIAKAMVELCGGTISLRSGPSGSTFTISAPAAKGHA